MLNKFPQTIEVKYKTLGEITKEIYIQYRDGNDPLCRNDYYYMDRLWNEGNGLNYKLADFMSQMMSWWQDNLDSAPNSRIEITRFSRDKVKKCVIGNHVLIFNDDINIKYIAYILSSARYQKIIQRVCNILVDPEVRIENLKKISIAIPPQHWQSMISSYMDTRIEVEKARRRAKLYEEYLMRKERGEEG